jgi:ElaB/YqjD/DUF883 family membrane-anchored ribosome-binding protein
MVNETGTLSDAAQRVEDRLESAKDSLGARVKERAGQVADTVKQQATNVREKIRQTNWDDVMNNVTGYVRDNPGKSIGIALGAGFALGVLLRRRGDD